MASVKCCFKFFYTSNHVSESNFYTRRSNSNFRVFVLEIYVKMEKAKGFLRKSSSRKFHKVRRQQFMWTTNDQMITHVKFKSTQFESANSSIRRILQQCLKKIEAVIGLYYSNRRYCNMTNGFQFEIPKVTFAKKNLKTWFMSVNLW